VEHFAGEKNDLVLLRNDRLVSAFADVNPILQPRVVNPQFTSLELPGLAMEEVDKRQMTGGDTFAAVIAVEVEEISVVARGYLGLHGGDGKFLHAELIENLWQHGLDAIEHHVLVLSQVHQNAGAPVIIIDHTTLRARRNDGAGAEVGFVLQREAHEVFKFLGRKEFVQHDALRRQNCRPLGNSCAGL